jgi:hypothetical protein
MLKNNLKDDGKRILLIAETFIDRLSDKNTDDRVKASLYVSESFIRLNMKTEAKMLILKAYNYAHSYDTKKRHSEMKKARLLSSVAQSVAKLLDDK